MLVSYSVGPPVGSNEASFGPAERVVVGINIGIWEGVTVVGDWISWPGGTDGSKGYTDGTLMGISDDDRVGAIEGFRATSTDVVKTVGSVVGIESPTSEDPVPVLLGL